MSPRDYNNLGLNSWVTQIPLRVQSTLASYPCPSYFLGHDVPSVARAWGQRGTCRHGKIKYHCFEPNICHKTLNNM